MLAIVEFDFAMYNLKSFPFTRGTRTGGFAKYLLMSSKASWCLIKIIESFQNKLGLILQYRNNLG